MKSTSSVTVTGTALTVFNRRTDGSSFRDWASTAFEDSLHRSTLEAADIDALFVASESDFFTLQLNPAAVLAADLGLVGAATFRVEGGGASGQLAVHAAVAAIRSGQFRHAAVVGVDPSASQLPAATVKSLYSYSFDAWTDGMTGVSATALYALSFLAFCQRVPASERHLAEVTIGNRRNAIKNPYAHLGRSHTFDDIQAAPMIASPYRRPHCSPLSDGAAAVVLSHPQAVPAVRKTAAQIIGIGAASDTIHLGCRKDAGNFSAKTRAMQQALTQADISHRHIDVAEIYDAYAGAQLQAIDALGLSDNLLRDLEAGRFAADGSCPVNLSGGLMGQGAPAGAIGVAQTATCAQLLEASYIADLQPQHTPRFALADTHGGICTTSAVTVLAANKAS